MGQRGPAPHPNNKAIKLEVTRLRLQRYKMLLKDIHYATCKHCYTRKHKDYLKIDTISFKSNLCVCKKCHSAHVRNKELMDIVDNGGTVYTCTECDWMRKKNKTKCLKCGGKMEEY